MSEYLPSDILQYLLYSYEHNTLLNTSITCSYLYNIMNDVDIWANAIKHIINPAFFKIIWVIIQQIKIKHENIYSSLF